jgi:thiol:disulfide interchange protein
MTGPDEPTEPIEPVGVRPADEPPADTPVPDPGGWLGVVRTHLGFAVVLLAAAVGIVRITQYHWRQGAALIGAALVLAALFRAILPARRAGLLAVRGRPVDVLSYAGLGALMLFVALTIQGGPFG